MPSHKELLKNRADNAERAYREAAEETDRIGREVKNEEKAIDQLTANYDVACRKLATGEAADPAAILAERDRRTHRLRGLEALLAEANERMKPLYQEHAEASRALQDEADREERERLEAAIVEANRKKAEAQAVLEEATKVVYGAVWARSQFLRKQELKLQGRV